MRGEDAVVLPLREVALRDVPGDGDCLFHALRMEFNGCAKTSRPKLFLVGRPALPDGAALRAWFLEYVRTTDAILDGLPASMWLEAPVEEYCEAMRRPDAADRNTWGGVRGSLYYRRRCRRQGFSSHAGQAARWFPRHRVVAGGPSRPSARRGFGLDGDALDEGPAPAECLGPLVCRMAHLTATPDVAVGRGGGWRRQAINYDCDTTTSGGRVGRRASWSGAASP